MLSKSSAFMLCILVLCDHILVGLSNPDPEGDEEESSSEGESSDVANFAGESKKTKKRKSSMEFFDGEIPPSDGMLGKIIGSDSLPIRIGSMSGLSRALDDRFIHIDNMGNPYGGMPEDLTGHIRMCSNFIFSGLYALIFINVRYPFKILTKTMVLVGAVTHVVTYANWCVNPIVALQFTGDGKKVNAHLERIAMFKDELKKRWIWITDKAKMAEAQMYACCAWHEYKSKIYEEAPECRGFTKFYFRGLYKIHEWIYCMKFQEGSEACEKVDLSPTNEEPGRVVAQSFISHGFELFDRFL